MRQKIDTSFGDRETRFTAIIYGQNVVRQKFFALDDAFDYVEAHESLSEKQPPVVEEQGYVPAPDIGIAAMVVRKYQRINGRWYQIIKQRYENDGK